MAAARVALLQADLQGALHHAILNSPAGEFMATLERGPDGALRLTCDDAMKAAFTADTIELMVQRAKLCSDADAAAREIGDIASARAPASASDARAASTAPGSARTGAAASHLGADALHTLVRQVESCGWHCVAALEPDFSALELFVRDAAARTHAMTVRPTARFPREPPDVRHDLPVDWAPLWTPAEGLGGLLHQLTERVTSLQTFWDVLDEFDTECVVLEPERPRRRDRHRRIALGNHSSAVVDIDPSAPRDPCAVHLFGAESVTRPLRATLLSRLPQWDPSDSPLANLRRLLDVAVPSRAERAARQDISTDCAICYAYRLGNVPDAPVPDTACPNARCAKPFHSACLYEWLQSLPTSRQSFTTLFGACPYCKSSIQASRV